MNGTQLRALVWLRWRLARNQWRRGGRVNAAITMILLAMAVILAVAGCVAGVIGGAIGLSQALPQATMLVWDGLVALFLFLWTMGIVTELQRSESIDASRLLHLPVSLRDVFVLNYLASHFSFSLTLMLPAMLGLAAGLVLGRGAGMVLLFPLVFGFFFMVTAWTYCLRGWLATLMVNKRRRRAIVMGITMAFVLLAQLPNLLVNARGPAREPALPQNASQAEIDEWLARRRDEGRQMKATLAIAHRYVPFLWLPQGAEALADDNVWPAIWGALGMFAIGAVGLARAYRTTLRFYQGHQTKRAAAAPAAAQAIRTDRKILVERTLPAIAEQASAMAMASLRSMSRAPEVKLALATNVLIFVILGASTLLRSSEPPPAWARPLLASGAVAMTFMGLVQVMFNHFGFDRNGFRSLVLLPTPRRHILLGKNLALLPAAMTVFAIYLALAIALAHLGAWDVVTAGFEFGGAMLALSALGNLASILLPYRVAAGSWKPTKVKGVTQLALFTTHLLLPLAILPAFLPAVVRLLMDELEWLPGTAAALACAVLLAVLSALFYWRTLGPLGRLLERREQRILQVVTQEVE